MTFVSLALVTLSNGMMKLNVPMRKINIWKMLVKWQMEANEQAYFAANYFTSRLHQVVLNTEIDTI